MILSDKGMFEGWKPYSLIQLKTLHGDLNRIRSEVKVHAYNAKRLSEKLKCFEFHGGNVPSVAYSLINLHAPK